jgi:hypothetical protein
VTAYLVLGPPRSGTSLVAGLLHNNGIPMSTGAFGDSSAANPAGYWEDNTLLKATIWVMSTAGHASFQHPPSAEEVAAVDRDGSARQVREWLEGRDAAHGGRDWGAKDPRLTLVWEHFKPLLRERGDVRLILCWRNPLAIACSLQKHFGVNPLGVALQRALRYESAATALLAVPGMGKWPILHVGFENWWRRFDVQAAALNQFVERVLNYGHFDESLWRE